MNKKLLAILSIIAVSSTAFAKEVMPAPETKGEVSLEARVESLEAAKKLDTFEFHGYFRTGSDGNFDNKFKRVGDRNKNLIGRWGNEYDSFTAFNFSKTFRMDNGAWAKAFVELDNWNNSLNISSDINLAAAKIEMGNIPGFTGAFKNTVITAGKQGWNNRAVDMTDYFYQDIDGVGLGIDGIEVGEGKLGLTYLTAEFEDQTQQYYMPSLDVPSGYIKTDNLDSSDSIRAVKGTYAIDSFTFEGMYAHSPDHDLVKLTAEDEDKDVFTRNTANNGIYAGLYYNPGSFYGTKGWGQHYVQYGTGVLAGAGLGRLNTYENMVAHKDSTAFQVGTGGGTNITEKLSVMTALRYITADKVDARDYNVTLGENSDYLKKQSELGFSVRPVYAINSYFDLWVEAGVAGVDSELYNGKKEDKMIWKLSAGPQLKLNFGFAETAVRAYVTYYNEDIETKEDGVKTTKTEDDVIGGFQMSVWW